MLFMELGGAVVGLAVLARLANRFRLSAIPLYLIGGLAFGKGGIAPLNISEDFIRTGAEIGVLLLLFMLGLEYTGEELKENLRAGFPAGVVDFALNFPPGLIAGLLMGWSGLAAVLLGGVTYISSSGVIAKVLGELRRLENPETPTLLSVLVIEDLAMAVYLPLIAALLVGGTAAQTGASVGIALGTVTVVLVIAVRYGRFVSRLVGHGTDEIVVLTAFGVTLLVAGVAQRLQVSAAIGAFLVGIAFSGPLAEHSHRLLAPMRDLFSATFFFFFGMEIDPATLPPAFPIAGLLAVVTAATKIATGYWAARRAGIDKAGRVRAGMALVARGEFSIVIAGLGAGVEPALGPLSGAYVLILAVVGPVLTRLAK